GPDASSWASHAVATALRAWMIGAEEIADIEVGLAEHDDRCDADRLRIRGIRVRDLSTLKAEAERGSSRRKVGLTVGHDPHVRILRVGSDEERRAGRGEEPPRPAQTREQVG